MEPWCVTQRCVAHVLTALALSRPQRTWSSPCSVPGDGPGSREREGMAVTEGTRRHSAHTVPTLMFSVDPAGSKQMTRLWPWAPCHGIQTREKYVQRLVWLPRWPWVAAQRWSRKRALFRDHQQIQRHLMSRSLCVLSKDLGVGTSRSDIQKCAPR